MTLHQRWISASLTLIILGGCATGHRASKNSIDYKKRASELAREVRKKNALIEELRERNLVLSGHKPRTEQVRVKSPAVTPANRREASVWEMPSGAFKQPLNSQLKSEGLPVKENPPAPKISQAAAPEPPSEWDKLPVIELIKTLPAKKTPTANASWANPPPAEVKATETTPIIAETGEHILYGKVMQSFRSRDAAELENSVRLFLKTYPDSVYADNALYLSGVMCLHRQDWPGAQRVFDRLLVQYATGNKAVSALFGKGSALKFSKDFKNAKQIYREVATLYRGSPEAFRVTAELRMIEKLEKAGHRP